MPQFDFYTFATQSFWVLVAFCVSYLFITRLYLPNLSEVTKMREKILSFYASNKSSLTTSLSAAVEFFKRTFRR